MPINTVKGLMYLMTSAKGYYFTDNNTRLCRQGLEFPLFHTKDENEMKHALNIMVWCCDIMEPITPDKIRAMARVFNMCLSIRAYGKLTINDEYLQGELYNIPLEAKERIVDYVNCNIKEVGHAGHDNEGLSYNYITMKKYKSDIKPIKYHSRKELREHGCTEQEIQKLRNSMQI